MRSALVPMSVFISVNVGDFVVLVVNGAGSSGVSVDVVGGNTANGILLSAR